MINIRSLKPRKPPRPLPASLVVGVAAGAFPTLVIVNIGVLLAVILGIELPPIIAAAIIVFSLIIGALVEYVLRSCIYHALQ